MKVPKRVLLKRAIFAALKDYNETLDEEFRFAIKQDYISEHGQEAWRQNQRLVVVYLDEVENQGSHLRGVEKAQFTILCVVSPDGKDENDDTTATEGLHYLADQVRYALYGHGPAIGLAAIKKHLSDGFTLVNHNKFNFKVDAEHSFKNDRLVMFGQISLEMSYTMQEYDVQPLPHGSGITVQRSEQ